MARHNPVVGMMPQIMQAWCGMRAAIGPVEVITQPEDTMHLSLAERLSQTPTTTAGEERGVVCRRHSAPAASAKARQRVDRAGMQGQLA